MQDEISIYGAVRKSLRKECVLWILRDFTRHWFACLNKSIKDKSINFPFFSALIGNITRPLKTIRSICDIEIGAWSSKMIEQWYYCYSKRKCQHTIRTPPSFDFITNRSSQILIGEENGYTTNKNKKKLSKNK